MDSNTCEFVWGEERDISRRSNGLTTGRKKKKTDVSGHRTVPNAL